MEKTEDLEKTLREAFEKKVDVLLASGIPPRLIVESLLVLYFDSLRISVDNISITHQIKRSSALLKQLFIMRIIELSNNLIDCTLSEEEIIFLKKSKKNKPFAKNYIKILTNKQLKKYSLQIHKEIMTLMHSEYARYNNMQILISALLFTIIHILYRLTKISEIAFIKIQKNWSDFFKNLAADVSKAVHYFYVENQKLH